MLLLDGWAFRKALAIVNAIGDGRRAISGSAAGDELCSLRNLSHGLVVARRSVSLVLGTDGPIQNLPGFDRFSFVHRNAAAFAFDHSGEHDLDFGTTGPKHHELLLGDRCRTT